MHLWVKSFLYIDIFTYAPDKILPKVINTPRWREIVHAPARVFFENIPPVEWGGGGGGALWTVHFLLDAILILPEAGNEKLKNSFFYVVITREKAKKNNLKEYVSKKKDIHIREEYNVQNQKRGFCWSVKAFRVLVIFFSSIVLGPHSDLI